MPIEIALLLFVVIIYMDITERIIPDWITLPGILYGAIFISKAGVVAGAVPMAVSGYLGIMIWDSPGIGGGDLKLMAMVGAFFGPWVAIYTYAIYPLLASLYAFSFEKKKVPCAPLIISTCLIVLWVKGFYAP